MKEPVIVQFDEDAYAADAVQRAAYKFSDRFSLELTRDAGVLRCALFFKSSVGSGDARGSPDGQAAQDDAIHEFRSEVLDQVLRDRIRLETEAVRNLILSVAFSRAGLSDTDG